MDWQIILQWSFLVSLISAAVRLTVPVLIAVLGEIITESSGILNLGLEGIMAMGAVTGFLCSYYLEHSAWGPVLGEGSTWIALVLGMLAGALMGLIMAVLSITLKADQVICGITLVVFGIGLSNYLYRQIFATLSERVAGLSAVHIPVLSDIPVVGDILFNHDPTVYLALFLVVAVWFFLFHTTFGLKIRSVGESPEAAETSGVSVAKVRYAATLIGASLVGLAGAVLTSVQLTLFREGITAGKGWIAVALVIFARWRHPRLALIGALLFGFADAIQYRIQALSQEALGAGAIPYEFLLMLPYILTIAVLYYRSTKIDQPAALGRPYIKGSR
jgi:general nucleoside transport system permease protein